MGKLLESLYFVRNPDQTELDKTDLAYPTALNFAQFGFEGLECELTGPKLTSKLKAVVKVQHQADDVVVDVHGFHDGTLLLNPPKPDFPLELLNPIQIDTTDTTIKRLYLISCEALDLHDYNNFFSSQHYPTARGHAETDGLAKRKFGGEVWDAKLPNCTKLGYNGPAPTRVLTEVTAEFRKRVNENSTDEQVIMAWLRANQEVDYSSEAINWEATIG